MDERRLDEGRTSRGSDGMHTRAHVRSVFLPVVLATAIASSIAVSFYKLCSLLSKIATFIIGITVAVRYERCYLFKGVVHPQNFFDYSRHGDLSSIIYFYFICRITKTKM